MSVQLTGNWYFESEDVVNLWISVELQLANGNKILLTPETWEATSFEITLPILSMETDANMAVSVLISATTVYDTSLILTKAITVNNTIPDSFRSSMYPVEFDKTDDLDIMFMAAQMKLTLQAPANGLYSTEICHRDSDCSNQGV
jgi:hypothetical protein